MDDFDRHALALLKFVEDSVHEAIEDPTSRQALLTEANCGLRVLRKTLSRDPDHESTFAKWSLLENRAGWDLEKIGNDHAADPKEPLLCALSEILFTRYFFGVPRPT